MRLTPSLGACRDCLREALGSLVRVCKVLSDLVSPVVCSSSPEGFLPADPSSSRDVSVLPVEGEEGRGNAQSLLLCCWHTMKEVSLLLGVLVRQFGVSVGAKEATAAPLLSHKQVGRSIL